ncbi:MAG: ribosome small subunit-dependent GTPase A [Acutalibacteraceae bacterium]|nr:ribosome small subunit-dependent GTPase A [Acutalibacteraceae bacterium]
MISGRIIKLISGSFFVESNGSIYECKGRGALRKKRVSPIVGDFVNISVLDEGNGVIEEVLQRKNELVRPMVANIDKLIIVCSAKDPEPNLFIIDKTCAIAASKKIETVIVFNKSDLKSVDDLVEIYRNAGYRTYKVCADNGCGIDEIKKEIKDNFCVFTGNSGVGKSSILNSLDDCLNIATAQISYKLGRGRHTTRHTEIYSICGGFIADTPGFSSFDTKQCGFIHKDDLQYCFPEFDKYIGQCRFVGCSHTKEKGCAVLKAIDNGEISVSRHNSYVTMYEEAKQTADWELNK